MTAIQRRTRRAEPITKRVAKNGTVSYEFRADLGVKPNGGRDRRRFTYPTLREARSEYRRISAEVAAGKHVARTTVTVAEHIDHWLSGRRDIRPVTLQGYRHALKPVVDRLGSLPLQQLTKKHVDDLVAWRLTEGRATGKPPLSATATAILHYVTAHPEGVTYSTVVTEHGGSAGKYLDRLREAGHVTRPRRGVYVATAGAAPRTARRGVSERTVTTMLVQLSAALDDAVAQGLLTRNVARLVERPSVTAPTMTAWTREQAAVFRAHVLGHRLEALWLLTLCGLRRSEVLGLTWEAVDLATGTVSIAQGRVAVDGARTELGAPKSTRSRRVLPVPPEVITALRAFKRTQAAERLALGGGYPDIGLVAVDGSGHPYRPEYYGDEFRRVSKAAGVPVIRLHDARHTAASLMLDAGHSVSAIAKWLGHDPAMTLRIYGHVYDDSLKSAGAALFGSTDNATG